MAVWLVLATTALAGPGAPELTVRVEPNGAAGPTPLWLGVKVTVTDEATGRAFDRPHLVFVAATDGGGTETEPFGLKVLELDTPGVEPGVHEGFVILPSGGTWRLDATVNRYVSDPEADPVVWGRGAHDVDVEGAGAAALTPTAGPDQVAADIQGGGGGTTSEAIVLWIHTLFAIGWALTVGLLALLALPAGRRLLSEAGAYLADRRLDSIIRATWWCTGLVVATGIYNLLTSVPYPMPLTPTRAERLFRLPYAEAYYLVLAVKLAVYAALVGIGVSLMGEAKRRAGTSGAPGAPSVLVRPPASSPFGTVALRTRPETATIQESIIADPIIAEPGPRRRVTLLAGGAVVLVAAVTFLKHLHLLSELARAG